MAELMHTAVGAKLVMIGQALDRELGSFMPTQQAVDLYNHNAGIFNSYLEVVSEDTPGVKFWKHRGFQEPDLETYGPVIDEDGVHLTPRGQYKFFKSVRGAILYAQNYYL